MYQGSQIKSQYAGTAIGTDSSSGYCDQERDISPVEQAMNRLGETIIHAQTQAAELQNRLIPVSVPHPVESGNSCGGAKSGTTCAIEERLNLMAENINTLARNLREAREMLAI